ncbi:YqaJ viral recombinase family protein [Luteolibacter flavescens]|uniref:YqaJ viral recombinase family protein n=1 Tax=Luteolibacter flavescens TaxID=1859460 RepID=A0ABT3FPV0_9BACT|nr:lambda exonuclease family protein [Luteolibacter flavescens]MCW1885600.1 YqaJ viral recombinase family protein [Luteolibacter flavescens]
MEQRTEQWFRARAGRPTASQFSRIVTPTGKDSEQWDDFALELVAQCIRPDEVEWTGNRHTDRGEELEPAARDLFREMMDLDVREVGFITRADEVIGCSPDALVYQRGAAHPLAGLEIKCPLAKHHARYLVEGVLPDAYRAQVHGSMAVTGLRWWYFMSYCPGLVPFVLRVEWDSYTDKLAGALDRFLVFYAERRKQVLPVLLGKEAA